MFDEVMGIPVHPLVVHAAVVFVPLLALLTVANALVPRWRSQTTWALLIAVVAAPATVYAATASGEELEHSLPNIAQLIEPHEEFGEATWRTTMGLALAVVVLLVLRRLTASRGSVPGSGGGPAGRSALSRVSVAVTVVAVTLALLDLYYVVRTGHSGADAVWGGD